MSNSQILSENTPAIRLMWKINAASGHGDWFPDNEQSMHVLQSWVTAMNGKYGANTHWISPSMGTLRKQRGNLDQRIRAFKDKAQKNSWAFAA